tara:strand:- start:422 stop:877 length:456 start_codon:yes stop_codon:yes gene_type:complete
MKKQDIRKMVMAIKPNYKPVKLVFYYSLGFYKKGVVQFYKGGLTDNIPKRLYDLRSYVQKRGYTVDFERDPHIFRTWKKAKKFEKSMLDKQEVRTDSPFGYFNGHTELFSVEPLGLAYDEGILEPNWEEFWDNFDGGVHHPAWHLGGWLFE